MFIKLHLQTKEIAKILLIDPRSVQTARYRIKKKMNLDEDIDLRAYLLKITS
jgi:DNA-binding CsgD family transcriptional regulator